MAELYYPQLPNGVIAHHPVRRIDKTRTITNILPDGTLVMLPDEDAAGTSWDWEYTGLSKRELEVIQSFFRECIGPLRSFTFLAPTENLLAASSQFESTAWRRPSDLVIESEQNSPIKDVLAVGLRNLSAAPSELHQELLVPSSYFYSYSVYLRSASAQTVTLFRRSGSKEAVTAFSVGSSWARFSTQGRLLDDGNILSVGLRLDAGQKLYIAAAQLEAQPSPSPYRDNPQSGGVFRNAHWAQEELEITTDDFGSYSVRVAVEITSKSLQPW